MFVEKESKRTIKSPELEDSCKIWRHLEVWTVQFVTIKSAKKPQKPQTDWKLGLFRSSEFQSIIWKEKENLWNIFWLLNKGFYGQITVICSMLG